MQDQSDFVAENETLRTQIIALGGKPPQTTHDVLLDNENLNGMLREVTQAVLNNGTRAEIRRLGGNPTAATGDAFRDERMLSVDLKAHQSVRRLAQGKLPDPVVPPAPTPQAHGRKLVMPDEQRNWTALASQEVSGAKVEFYSGSIGFTARALKATGRPTTERVSI